MRIVSKLVACHKRFRKATFVAVLVPVALVAACARQQPPPPAPAPVAPPAPAYIPPARG